MDKTAMGHDFIAKVDKHGSQVDKYKCKYQEDIQIQTPSTNTKYTTSRQVDAAKGFGGKFGVGEQKDKSALGWDHLEKVEKHTSSKGNFSNSVQKCPWYHPFR